MNTRNAYPSGVTDAEWEFVVPYLSSLPLGAGQRAPDLREIFNRLRWMVERNFGFRRLRCAAERRTNTLVDLHVVAFACLMLNQAIGMIGQES